ncbi:hypothetical protein [Flavobacterium piscis]|uniref:Tetratricopeptide (TPR) repeat protein n=1 Tax=Flavobacterium piscis TaxID=1114874 RepID=A0ABU1YCX5_9FLAO|nr:hypothetical protein [Flavobacterium piscis]MDR7212087.1 tetratricopeptide (TPR) repeat protein [Flavobacterium piscis]
MKKNCSFYKKTEEVYFSTELAFLIIPILIASAITYCLLYFFNTTVAILFNVFISFCANLYIYALGSSYSKVPFSLLISTILTSALLLFVNYGVYALVVYQDTGVFNEHYFQIWLAILFGAPILYYVFQYSRYYFRERSMAVTYLKVYLTVHHDRELLTVIDHVQFVNTSNRTMSDIKLEKPLTFYSEEELFKLRNDMSIENYLEKNVFSGRVQMPFGADVLFMSWYSVIEDKCYDIEVPFPFEKLVIEQEKYPTNVSAVLRGKKTKPLKLHIHVNGGIRLFNEDTILIDLPESAPAAISDEERNKKIEFHRDSHEYYKDPKAFSDLIQKIRASNGIEERFLINNKQIPWSFNVTGLKGENYLEIYDVLFHKYKIEINEIETAALRFLPRKIEIVYRGHHLCDWLILFIDYQKLYHAILEITEGNEEIPVVFDLIFENSPETSLKFSIASNDKTVVFNDWKIKIKKDRHQDMTDHLLDRNEDEQKRTLYKEAWDLVASKQYDLAQEKCDKIKAIDPRFGFAYFLEARLVWYKEGFEACYAKKDYFIAKTQHEPAALAHIYNSYGCILDQELRFEEAASFFDKAILTNKKEGIYLSNRAEMHCKLKDPKSAVKFARKAKEIGYESAIVAAILKSGGLHYS